MPRNFFLDDPTQLFVADFEDRRRNKLQRSQWQMALRSSAAQPRPQLAGSGRPMAGAGGGGWSG
eukprot:2408489-Pyramimonas_sp.AAC.1